MNEEYEITPEEQAAFMEWWDRHIPKNFITMLDPAKYAVAMNAIKTIIAIIGSCCEDEDEMPEFDVKYDAVFGTRLTLKIKVTEFGLKMLGYKLANIVKVLPSDCIIDIMPLKENRTLIDVTFRNIKQIIAHSEAEDLPATDENDEKYFD